MNAEAAQLRTSNFKPRTKNTLSGAHDVLTAEESAREFIEKRRGVSDLT
jgi:hypothetical protein